MEAKKILLAPHNDDEALFASYTCMRERPLVVIVTDSWKQWKRGDNITAEERRKESSDAMRSLGCEVVFLGIPDTKLTGKLLREKLKDFNPDVVYAPAVQGGNAQHDLVGREALCRFRNVIQYSTYSKTELYTTGDIEIVPTKAEEELKNAALLCYQSQINYHRTAHHFEAVRGKSEWVTKNVRYNFLQKLWNYFRNS